jgi:hypothetical protein
MLVVMCLEEEPVGEKGSRGRKKARESIKAVNVSKHILLDCFFVCSKALLPVYVSMCSRLCLTRSRMLKTLI